MSEMDTWHYGRGHINSDELDPADEHGDEDDEDEEEDDEDDEEDEDDDYDDEPVDEDEDDGDEDEDDYGHKRDDGETTVDTALWQRDHINRDDWDPAQMLDDHSGYSSWQQQQEHDQDE